MEEHFKNSNRMWTRRDIPGGPPVKVTVKDMMFGPYPAVCTRWDGPHILTDGENEWTCGHSVTHDAGKYGLALTFAELPAPVSEEERRANRDALDKVIREIWPGMRLKPKEPDLSETA